MEKNKFINKISSLLFYISILSFIIAFNFAHNPPGAWYQQSLPNIGNRNIVDITFLDSLNGYAISSIASDTSLILKTTNGGNNWWIANRQNSFIMTSIEFIDGSTGFVGGTNLIRTTDSGISWNSIYPFIFSNDLSFINQDTGWYVDSEGLLGGVFRTTNSGINWTHQVNLGGNNPTHIYMYNKDTGYVAGTTLYKTTNSGIDWLQIPGGGFGDMYFINATTGWKCYGPMQKTTDGGLSWQNIPLPPKSDTLPLSRVISFSNINADTIWAVGSVGVIGSSARGVIYLTTNGGTTWSYQLPDISINIFRYLYIQFVNKNIGWSYGVATGVHTVTGGDTTITNIINPINETPENFKLFQNYPNPFNPKTIISFQLSVTGFIIIKVYNALGTEIETLVNQKHSAGSYNVRFDGNNVPSGVYFYSLFIEGVKTDTKKMLLIR
ncbi:MAG: T9SS type A sorting domain-containing protein [Ignavibacteria bacterium]|nr:T9SS type A sorting domain-containing protein [Ignavibacteria bacterium]